MLPSIRKVTDIDMLQNNTALDAFVDALTCSPEVYTWHYDATGTLLQTNCTEIVYHEVFRNSECFEYMLKHGQESRFPLILSTRIGLMWCAAFEYNEDQLISSYVIGPVLHDEVNKDLIESGVRRLRVPPDTVTLFRNAIMKVPAVSSILFFQYGVMLHYYITGEKISRSELRFQKQQSPKQSQNPPAKRSRKQTYRIEQSLLQMIRDGNPDYHKAMDQAGQISSGVGISTGDPVKRAILSSSNFVALCTRAAIDGGLSPDTAYTVGDSYIQSLTECRTISDVRTVNHTMYEDFIHRVQRQRTSLDQSVQIRSCASYIETHLDEDLSLDRLAKEIGYSGCHLSRKFKEETGMTIRDYIKKARISRAMLLLTTTDMNISDISEHLRFCSSSHFSDVFRTVTGMLPGQYRNENRK